jgi:predicted amidohydrolase YtcJ
VTHEYTLLVGATVILGDGQPDAQAIAWAAGTILAIGGEDAVRAISRGDSHVVELDSAWVVPLGFAASVGLDIQRGPDAGAGSPAEATLEVGGPADLAVLDRDPRIAAVVGPVRTPIRVLALVRGGRVVAGELPGGPAHDHSHEADTAAR